MEGSAHVGGRRGPGTNGRPGAPTLEMVAEAAGVSRATVSRVVNGSPKVRPDVARQVRDAIRALNYVPNRAARSLAGRHTYALALIVPEDTSRFFGDPYFAAITRGITRRLDDSDYILNLLVASADPDHKTLRYLQGGNVDGAFVVSHHSGDTHLAGVADSVPLVLGGRPYLDALRDCYYVDVDNVAGAGAATRHLIDRGRRRIGTVTGPADMPAAADRLTGWRDAMAAAGLDDRARVAGDFTLPGGARAARMLLDRHPELDAIFVANDLMAAGVLSAVLDRGLRVPDDLALVGYDDSPAATAGEVALTTVRQPSERMGATMADYLLGLLADEPPADRACILQTELVVRDSS